MEEPRLFAELTWSSDKACDCDILGNRFFGACLIAFGRVESREKFELGLRLRSIQDRMPIRARANPQSHDGNGI